MLVIVASTNPVKLEAAQRAFQRMFPGQAFTIQGVSLPSGVPDQPRGDHQTLQGARNRAEAARQCFPQADFWVGIEGGVQVEEDDEMSAFAWVVVCSQVQMGKGCTGKFYLPAEVARLVASGVELGEADDLVFAKRNSKQQNGAVGLLTGDVIDRVGLYTPAVVLALIPFKNPDLYPQVSRD